MKLKPENYPNSFLSDFISGDKYFWVESETFLILDESGTVPSGSLV
jgi:hypothetical protein